MKIKCLWENCGEVLSVVDTDTGNLVKHYVWVHNLPTEIVVPIIHLQFKIHEKIKLLKERKKIEGKQEVPMPTDMVIPIFESLLEDER